MDSLKSLEGAGEVVFAEENLQNVSPWWQQFPKSWVIALLCFAAICISIMQHGPCELSYCLIPIV